ncbi:hypothetical protein DFJ73DRAFT_814462 [Zopfochytrium polystomum]|nr:hypothetical protein DFJ73DRAFT_814462 [Zopfochytrium polystomum]
MNPSPTVGSVGGGGVVGNGGKTSSGRRRSSLLNWNPKGKLQQKQGSQQQLQRQQQALSVAPKLPQASALVHPRPIQIDVHTNAIKFTREALGSSFQFNGSITPTLLEALSQQRLTPDNLALFDPSDFHKGVVLLQVRDHRVTLQPESSGNEVASGSPAPKVEPFGLPPQSGTAAVSQRQQPGSVVATAFPIQSTPASTWAGIVSFVDPAQPVTEDLLLDVEAKILAETEPLCLDPSPSVAALSNLIAYNESKYHCRRKRSRDQREREEEAAEQKQNVKMMLIVDEKRDFNPTFSRLQFIEDYRQRKAKADSEVMVGQDFFKKKPKKNAPPAVPPPSHLNTQPIYKTVRFEQEMKRGKLYTILNVVETGRPDEYEAILRWGDVEGTAVGPLGGTMRFPVGNAAAAENYISIFKNFYGIHAILK